MFRVYGSGFKMDLDNGYTISIMFGPFNMCSNRQHEKEYKEKLLNMKIGNFAYIEFDSDSITSECRNAETAVIDTVTGNFIDISKRMIDPDTNKAIVIKENTQGYQNVNALIHLINEVKDYPNTDSKVAEIKEKQGATRI